MRGRWHVCYGSGLSIITSATYILANEIITQINLSLDVFLTEM